MNKLSFLKDSKLKEEYENIFSSLNNLKTAVKNEKFENISELFNQFMSFLKNYFEKETKLMEEFKYPDLEDHKKEHDLLQKKLDYFFLKREKEETGLSYEMIEILEEILIDHITKFDKPFNLYLTTKMDIHTDFLSKKAFLEKLQDFIESPKLSEDISLVLLEIDDFPIISFTFGNEISELLLTDFSIFLRTFFDMPNIIFGISKENQILIALIGLSFLEILSFLEDLVEKIKSYKFKVKNQTISLSTSIGVALYPQDGENAFELFKSAEIALQVSKKEGKNRWVFFESKYLNELEKLNRIKTLLEWAIREHSVIPYIQPIIDATTRKIAGGEVLLRLLDEKGSIICAGTFINYAYELGYIEELEAILTEKITAKEFLELFKNKYVFINKSVTTYDKARFLSEEFRLWKELTDKFEFFCIFEITESSILEFLDIFQIISSETNTEKTGIAIDDFGSGYASFTSLIKIDPKFLKIDGSLIREITKTKKCYTIVKGIVTMAKELSIKTIAEFVNSEKEAEILKNIGVEFFQSFYFCKPLPLEEFKKLVS